MLTASPLTLGDRMTGRVVLPGDPDFAGATQAFNLLVDQRPVAVAFPVDERDVVAVVDFAREHGLRVAPQSTGHNAGPLGSLDGTLLVNVSELSEITIDVSAHRVRVGAGVRWEQVVPLLSDVGFAALHGSSPDVGIAGYSLGGGMGWLARRHGLQANAVTAIELVTADGCLVRTDPVHEPDLFWALRGGGGNFGVVTAIEFAVVPVGEVYAGALFFPFARTRDVLHAWTAMLPGLPDELMTWTTILHFPDVPDVPEPFRGGSYTVVMGAYLGTEADGQALLRPLRALAPVMDTFAMVPPSGLSDLAMDPRDPLPIMSAHHLLGSMPPVAVERLLEAAGPESADAGKLAMVQLRHMGGALSRRAPGAGARATLEGEICVFALGVVPDASFAPAVSDALAGVRDALAPWRVGDYPNFVEEESDASGFFDAATWARLRDVKALYDPADMFRGNHHVRPAAAAVAQAA
jgi:FAD/FMN-containing dehydrogenase